MTEILEPETSERSKVESWRLHVLIEAGYPLPSPSASPSARPTSISRSSSCSAAAARTRPPPRSFSNSPRRYAAAVAKVEALPYDDRTVYSVAAFNRGVAQWLGRLPTVWVEGEVTELRRHERWASVFFTLKDPADGSCVGVTMPRGQFDGLRLELADGERVHVYGRPELFEQPRRLPPARAHDRALRRRRAPRRARAAEDEARRRGALRRRAQAAAAAPPAPHRARHRQRRRREARRAHDDPEPLPARERPRRRDVRPGTARAARDRRPLSATLCAQPDVDVIVLARGGGSFEDLLPVQRRARRARGRGVPRAGRLGRRPRAGHAALRPRRRRPRVDADGGRPARRPRALRLSWQGSTARATRWRAASGARSTATPQRARARARAAARRAEARARARGAPPRARARPAAPGARARGRAQAGGARRRPPASSVCCPR